MYISNAIVGIVITEHNVQIATNLPLYGESPSYNSANIVVTAAAGVDERIKTIVDEEII